MTCTVISLSVTSQASSHCHRDPIIAQYQIIYTLSLLDTSKTSHQIRQSEVYLLPTISVVHPPSASQLAGVALQTLTKESVVQISSVKRMRVRFRLQRFYKARDVWISVHVQLHCQLPQKGRGLKQCVLFYAQFTEGLVPFVDRLVLQLTRLFSWIVLGLLGDIGEWRTWLAVWGPAHLWICGVEPQILKINDALE